MFDDYLVNKTSLKNVYDDDGNAVGFKFGVRLSNYRGIFLSLVNDFYVNMDGKTYDTGDFALEVNHKAPRTMEALKSCTFEQWNMQDEAILYVRQEGGLSEGTHHLEYLPITMDGYGYQAHDERWVTNPPKPGEGGGKQLRAVRFELVLNDNSAPVSKKSIW